MGFVTPEDKLKGRAPEILAAQDRKLETAREARKLRGHNRVDKGALPMMK
jgi:hypothetical protein